MVNVRRTFYSLQQKILLRFSHVQKRVDPRGKTGLPSRKNGLAHEEKRACPLWKTGLPNFGEQYTLYTPKWNIVHFPCIYKHFSEISWPADWKDVRRWKIAVYLGQLGWPMLAAADHKRWANVTSKKNCSRQAGISCSWSQPVVNPVSWAGRDKLLNMYVLWINGQLVSWFKKSNYNGFLCKDSFQYTYCI